MGIAAEFDSVLAAAQAGSEWAFASIYRDLNPGLSRYFHAQAGPSASEDLAAETWMAAARTIGGFQGGPEEFRAWLYTIAHRRLVQHWRDLGRRPSHPVAPEDLHSLLASSDPEAQVVSETEAQRAVTAIRAALPADQAEVVLLRIVGGLDVAQVAEVLGKRPGTVRVLQHRAMKKLANAEIFPPEV